MGRQGGAQSRRHREISQPIGNRSIVSQRLDPSVVPCGSKILLFYCLFSNPARSVIALLAPPCANSRSKSSFNGVNRFSIRSRDPHDSFFRRPSTNPLRKYRHQGTESKARIREKYEVKVRSIFQPLRSSSF